MTHFASPRIVQWSIPCLLLSSLSSARNPGRLSGASLIHYVSMLLERSYSASLTESFLLVVPTIARQLRLGSSANRDGPNEHRSLEGELIRDGAEAMFVSADLSRPDGVDRSSPWLL
ncbi:MAG: hypothetical protein QOJ51_141 [Acidobacteriaceae bacterium]|jgi:hypothetical protein|nr:hypothetical protein [Acidobacteriaceae bacterium]